MRMFSMLLHCSMLALAAGAASSASAQTAPAAPKPKPQPQAITVTGQRSDVVSTADRLSFSVAKDLQAQTGTMADVLRNVPGVEVDLQGNVSLRGDSGVKILVDGRPSAALNGDNRGNALLAMSANQIERVEVITNPSASMSPEGSGGVLNLVTKHGKQDSRNASARVTFGGLHRYGLNLSASQSANGTSINGDLGYRHFAGTSTLTDLRSRLDPATGTFIDSRLDSEIRTAFDAKTAKLSVDHDIDKANRVSAEFNLQRFAIDATRDDDFASEAASGDYMRHTEADIGNRVASGKVSWRRTLPGKGHELAADLQIAHGRFQRDLNGFTDFASGGDLYEHIRNAFSQMSYNPQLDYKRPIGSDTLNLGYEGDFDRFKFDFFGARGPAQSSLVEVPALTNRFNYDQRVHAFYGTYDFTRGKLETEAGLRLEQAGLDIDQITDATRFTQHYFRAYPTLHLNYQLSKTDQLRGSYSRRIQRPSPQDLNPYTIYIDPLTVRRGNPYLLPEITDSFELGWQKRKGTSFYSLTSFYRRSTGGVTDVISDIGGGVFLTTRANLATARRIGLDAIANGKITKTLTYNASGTLMWNEIDPKQAGFERRSGTTGNIRGNLTWQPNKKDLFQLNAVYSGKQLMPQGYRLSSAILNLGYRRNITDKLSLTVSGQDVLGTARQVIYFTGPALRDRLTAHGTGRAILATLGYNWGKANKRKQDPGFDFQQQGGGAAVQ